MHADTHTPPVTATFTLNDVPPGWHWHTADFGPGEHTESHPACHGTSAEAARDAYARLLNQNRAVLPGCPRRCGRDDCWTCTSNELIDKAIDDARQAPAAQLRHLHHTYTDLPLGERRHSTIDVHPPEHCQAH